MMFRILGMVVVLGLVAGTAEAQYFGGYHSSTAREGYLRGRGAAATGAGNYLESLGRYQNLNQEARRKALENWDNRVRTRWDIKDEYKARFKRDHPSWPERRMHQLDMIEARAAVQLREAEMREKGLLPPKPESSFGYKGVKYKSYAEFKTTPAYQEMIAERDARFARRDAEEAAKKARYDASVKFLAERARMSPSARLFHDQKAARERNLKRIMGEEWWNKHMSNPVRR